MQQANFHPCRTLFGGRVIVKSTTAFGNRSWHGDASSILLKCTLYGVRAGGATLVTLQAS